MGGESDTRSAGFKPPPPIHQEPSPFRFEDVTKAAGVDFVNVSGMTPEKHFPSANGCGAAVFDADGDGKMDLYFANATRLPVGAGPSGPNRFYLNLGGGKFRDATESSGLGFAGFCHGIAVGDVDNDGDADVFLANLGANKLYLNDGKGHFADASPRLRAGHPGRLVLRRHLLRRRRRRRPGPLRPPLRPLGVPPRRRHLLGGRRAHLLLPQEHRAAAPPLLSQRVQADRARRLRRVRHGGRLHPRRRPRLRGGRRRPQRRRQDRPVRLQRHDPQLPVSEQGGRHVRRPHHDRRRRLRPERPRAVQHGGRRRGRGRRRPAGAVRDELPERAEDPLPEPSGAGTSPTSPPPTTSRPPRRRGSAGAAPWRTSTTTAGPTCSSPTATSTTTARTPPTPSPALLLRNIADEGRRRFELSTRDVGPYFAADHVGRGVAFGDLDDDGRLDIVVNQKDAPPARPAEPDPLGRRALGPP